MLNYFTRKAIEKRGFTLIELLVVISIIGLLSSVILASLNSARMKARDAKRKADLHSLETAVQFYYDDNGTFPDDAHTADGDWQIGFKNQMAPYISNLPIDPLENDILKRYYIAYRMTHETHGYPETKPCEGQYVVAAYLEKYDPSVNDCELLGQNLNIRELGKF